MDPSDTGTAKPPAADPSPLPASTGDALSLERFLGRVPVALCFSGSLGSPVTQEVIRGFDQHLADFGRSRVQALVVVTEDGVTLDRVHPRLDGHTPVLADERGEWRERFGVRIDEAQATTVLVGLDGEVTDVLAGPAGGRHAEEVLALVSSSTLDRGGPHDHSPGEGASTRVDPESPGATFLDPGLAQAEPNEPA